MRWSFATIVLVPRGRAFTPPSSVERRNIFAWAKSAGFAGVELSDLWLDVPALDERALRELRTEVHDTGLAVSAFNVPRCLPTREPYATAETNRLERALVAAGALEAEILNISLSLPIPPEGAPSRPTLQGHAALAGEHERAVALVDRLARRAGAAGVSLALELHDDGLLDTPELCLQLLERVHHPGVGVNPDIANMCRAPGAAPDWRRAFELLAPHTTNWHVKNFRRGQPAPVSNGDIDFAVAWNIMRAAGYDGWVSIESRFGDVLAEQRAALAFFTSLDHPASASLFPMSYTVFYYNPGATAEVCAGIRAEMPPDWRLTTAGNARDCIRDLGTCDFILVADRAITTDDIAAAPRLRMIQHQGVGYEKIDLAACSARGIPVAITPEGTSTGVAEHTLLLILALYKQLLVAANAAREGRWLQWELRMNSHELAGKTLGLVGFGRIGREVARRAAAFDARVIYFDPAFSANPASAPATRLGSLAELLRAADIVSLHVPLARETRKTINAESLAQMKRGAILINTSRGGLVDETALIAALDSGHLGGAGLDVLATEPAAANHPLLQRANVIVTPHISAGTRDALAAKMRAAFANMLRHVRNEPLHHLVSEPVVPLHGK